MNIVKYIIIFVTVLVLLLTLLVGVATIPKTLIETNIKESVEFYKKNHGIEELQKRREYTFLHLYADTVLLNIIYNIDKEAPIESVMSMMIYKENQSDVNDDFIKLIEEKKEPNKEYLRYWHGSVISTCNNNNRFTYFSSSIYKFFNRRKRNNK